MGDLFVGAVLGECDRRRRRTSLEGILPRTTVAMTHWGYRDSRRRTRRPLGERYIDSTFLPHHPGNSSMDEDSLHRFTIIAIGLLIIFTPVAILAITVGFFFLTEDLRVGDVTLLEFLEVYILDLAVFALAAYVIYRLALKLIDEQLPESLDQLDTSSTDDEEE
jgi:hypothetical protein